jgi:hypothetical protein
VVIVYRCHYTSFSSLMTTSPGLARPRLSLGGAAHLQLPATPTQTTAQHRMTTTCAAPTAWALPCSSGRDMYLPPHRGSRVSLCGAGDNPSGGAGHLPPFPQGLHTGAHGQAKGEERALKGCHLPA